jgi:hypothetical protein
MKSIIRIIRRKLFGIRVIYWLKKEMTAGFLRPADNIHDEMFIGYLFINKNYAGGGYVESVDGIARNSVNILAKMERI